MSEQDQGKPNVNEEEQLENIAGDNHDVKSKWEAMAESTLGADSEESLASQAETNADMADLLDTEAAGMIEDITSPGSAELLAAIKRIKELENANLKAQADVQNIQRRTHTQVENAHKFALEKFVGELLGVIDSLERGLETTAQIDAEASPESATMREGMELTYKLFLDTVAKFGVEPVRPVGEKFNPDQHNAVQMIESDQPENTVVQVLQPGYLLNGRLVRPAMVIISKS